MNSTVKLALVFVLGFGLGFLLRGGLTDSRVVYSGAMTEVEGREAWGPDDAPVTIVEYTDYECSFCARYSQTILPQILDAYEGRIRYLVRHFPLAQIHRRATRAAQAAVCAEQQGAFWEYHDLLFSGAQGLSEEGFQAYASQAELDVNQFGDCMASMESAQVVQDDLERGMDYGVTGTPAFFINGRVVYGAQPLENFRRIIDAALEDVE
jgi:protein-disulfide isomerase